MGSCHGQKMHIQNNGEYKTGNGLSVQKVFSSGGSIGIRKKQAVDQRNKRLMRQSHEIDQYAQIMGNDYQIQMQDIEQSPYSCETTGQPSYHLHKEVKPASALYYPQISNSLLASTKNKKTYQSSAPKTQA